MTGALVGFALAFLLVSWGASASLATLAWWADRRGADAAVGRTLGAVAILVPPVLGGVVVAAIAVDSLARLAGGGDHCLPHAHHLHLCVAHGGGWAASPAAMVAVAVAAALVAAQAARIAVAHIQGGRGLRSLARVAEARGGAQVVPSDRVFLFAGGILRPRVYASSAAWDQLSLDERAAALAHERAHIRGRDLLWRAFLSVAAALGAPIAARAAGAAWNRATERLRDADAAAEVGADVVACTLVRLARAGAVDPGWGTASMAAGADVVARVEALLSAQTPRRRAARALAVASGVAVLAAAVLVAWQADPVHHALETILGVF